MPNEFSGTFILKQNDEIIDTINVATKVTSRDILESQEPGIQTEIKKKDCVDAMILKLKSLSSEI